MIRKIETSAAPAPIGPYSQAIASGSLLWVSGCIALDPLSGHMVQDTLEAETRQVLANLQAIVEGAGASMAKIVKTTIYLTDMSAFPVVNEIYSGFVSEPFPARETVAVSALPKGARVEVSCVVSL
jgi:2-iminobutanoate/2-iminopropanoate deaminase